jgi:IS605 OrfB family transposase
MIRSTQVTTKFANPGKAQILSSFLLEYREVVSHFVDLLWELEKVPTLPPLTITSQVKTILSARAKQAAAKQASAIVRGTRTKENRRLWQIAKFKKEGAFKKARKLEAIYNKVKASKPDISSVSPELDSRFVKIDLDSKTCFDGWITISSTGFPKIQIPFKRTKHFNRLLARGSIKTGLRLSKKSISFNFDIAEPHKLEAGSTLGIDIGQNSILTCSNGQAVNEDSHGHSYKSICQKLSRKKKGSKGFARAEKHRSNYIGWALNQLDLTGIKEVRRERIKGLRAGRAISRLLSHWNYGELFERLDRKLSESGVQVALVSPTYTSQRCSQCGWVRKSNRKGLLFKCSSCDFTANADLNGAINIGLLLPAISKEARLSGINKKGFYWFGLEQEFIVPVTQETLLLE